MSFRELPPSIYVLLVASSRPRGVRGIREHGASPAVPFPSLELPEGHHADNPMFGSVGRLKGVCSASVNSLLRPDLLS